MTSIMTTRVSPIMTNTLVSYNDLYIKLGGVLDGENFDRAAGPAGPVTD